MRGTTIGVELVFWSCLFLVAYTYFLYPVLLFLVYSFSQVRRDWQYLGGRRERRVSALESGEFPAVSVIVPAHNEEAHLPRTINSLRQLDYPREQLEIIFVSDGSTDATNEILEEGIDGLPARKIFLPQRQGKSNALNQAVAHAGNGIVVLMDASTLLAPDAVRKLVRHFADPRAGVVCGALKFEGTTESRQTEGVYWRYESILRLMEARLGATLTPSGAICAVRKSCYQPLPVRSLIDDFMIAMNARKLGYRVIYDPEATATEFAAPSVAGEFARRVRLAAGSFQALPELLRTPMPGFTSVAFVSHKLLRWILPFLLLGLLISNGFLFTAPLYAAVLAAQLGFYLWACLGYVFRGRMQRVPYALFGYFMLAMNVAFLVGFARSLRRRQEGTWRQVG